MQRKQFNREWKRNNRALHTLLLLVDIEVTPSDIATWTDAQAKDAEWWAGHEHLRASDNAVRRYPKPDFLPPSETDKRLDLWGVKRATDIQPASEPGEP